ncbi:ATP-binding domain-containing protein [Cytobacillus sp.]|uniref:DEAD/DEAH box helicase n=1 Tax=Cytobacillus sp. TaxID=2675269 RepID=UPI0028BD8295|nr:ATP-binding domain-containing protein [Cytobacillus sp.]
MVKVIRGASEKYASVKSLIEYFEERAEIDGILYLGYPIIGSVEGAINIDAMLVSKQHGVVIFDLCEGIKVENRSDIRDELYNKVKSKLTDYKTLHKRRDLMVEIGVVTFASGWKNMSEKDREFDEATKYEHLDKFLDDQQWSNKEYYEYLLQAIQAITKIRTSPKRKNVKKENSRGAKLQRLEDSIANLDHNQSAAVIETVDGPQRIRGLAGSGKTIVLALKVAYLHAKNPDWNIAVTFNTRALKKQFEDLITRFTYEHKRDEPNWEKIKIIQAWGSPNSEGIYYNLCKVHGIEYYDLGSAKSLTFNNDYFKAVCKKALKDIEEFIPMYDVILVDEAQDFSKEFLLLCYEILENPKRLIFAYDELQSLNKNTMPSPEEIFGVGKNNKPRVQLKNEKEKPKEDIILDVCYRNSRPLLASAHALGFGIYRDKGIVQMFGNETLWKEVGYDVIDGELKEGKNVTLARNLNSSPPFLENHSPIDDLIIFKSFKSDEEQAEWIADEIRKNITEDELRYQDIMVIHTDPITTQEAVKSIRGKLYKMGIGSHIAGAANPDIFVESNSITFTGIYRAKGNEAGMIYVINGQNCFGGLELARKRNILFTGITRSKAWVRVSGYGEAMNKLVDEFETIKENDFELSFKYPTEEERKKLNIVNRDMTKDVQKKLENTIGSLTDVIISIQKGEIYLEDLPEDLREALKGLLTNES